jgi:glyoxylase-like metal-dependent hydrolase (beta-lactamase superfamily II)
MMNVGAVRIDPVVDGTLTSPAADVLRRLEVEDAWAAHQDLLSATGELVMPVGGFLVHSGDRVILVDAGLGPLQRGPYRSGALLDNLAALGLTADDVTDVVLTHLHFDHVGWVTQKGIVTFEHATYRCHASDWEYFVSSPEADAGAVRKLGPLAGRLEMFAGDATLAPGIDVRDAPGHTPGSTIVIVSSGAERALLLGDVAHCPMELTEPDWEAVFDVDPALARRTRETLARELEGTDVPAAAAHFPGMRFGRLLAGSARRVWSFD